MFTRGELIDGRYVIRGLLGRGGMAEVHRATDLVDGRVYALKVVHGTEPGLEERFEREADALARVDHPGLIALHRTGTHRGARYLVLDLAEGPPLSQVLASGPVGVERAASVGREVATALAHVHAAGMVHRDVKPSNILLHRGRLRLADFGIARLHGSPSLTVTGQVVGSAPYLAPEQVQGEAVGPPADVYALGLVVIECLTGHRCFPGTHAESAIARLHRSPEIPAVPGWLHDVLAAMTVRDPARRPPAAAVAAAFARRDADPVFGPTVAAPARTSAAPARRAGARVLTAAAVVLLTLGWTLLGGDPPAQPDATASDTPPTTAVALVADPLPAAAAVSPASSASSVDRSDADRRATRGPDPAPPPAAAAAAVPAAPASTDPQPPAAPTRGPAQGPARPADAAVAGPATATPAGPATGPATTPSTTPTTPSDAGGGTGSTGDGGGGPGSGTAGPGGTAGDDTGSPDGDTAG